MLIKLFLKMILNDNECCSKCRMKGIQHPAGNSNILHYNINKTTNESRMQLQLKLLMIVIIQFLQNQPFNGTFSSEIYAPHFTFSFSFNAKDPKARSALIHFAHLISQMVKIDWRTGNCCGNCKSLWLMRSILKAAKMNDHTKRAIAFK